MEHLVALDIETEALEQYKKDDNAALNPFRDRITVVGLYNKNGFRVYSKPETINYPCVTHNGKFDFKHLVLHGYPVDIKAYAHDTALMAVACSEKIPENWLERYESQRLLRNKESKGLHRKAGRYSLKTLAPYFLGVEPFWETADHSDINYVTKDVEYTYKLFFCLKKKLEEEGSWDFYKKLMEVSHVLLRAELTGVRVDSELLKEEWKAAEEALSKVETTLHTAWRHAYVAYANKVVNEINEKYAEMEKAAVNKLKDKAKEQHTRNRYKLMRDKAIIRADRQLNLGSPSQLKWLFKDYFGFNVDTFDGEDESTGKAVLQRLAGEGRTGVKEFLEYRKLSKLCTAFFPSYQDYAVNGRLYTSFNLQGTRTGRLSSSGGINLQQIPRNLMKLFVPSDGHKFIYYDLAGIEPVIIAWLSECPVLCDLLISGRNFHSENVRVFFGLEANDKEIKEKYGKERDLAKEVGLSLLYGAQAGRLHESAVKRGFKWSRGQCEDVYGKFREYYEDIFEYKRKVDSQYREEGYVVSPFGRPCVPASKRDITMQGFNTLVQSTASDMLIFSVAKAEKEWNTKELRGTPLLFIHDAVVVEARGEDATNIDTILHSSLTGWSLTTPYGKLPLKSDGGIRDRL